MTRWVCPICQATIEVLDCVTEPPTCSRHLKLTKMEKENA